MTEQFTFNNFVESNKMENDNNKRRMINTATEQMNDIKETLSKVSFNDNTKGNESTSKNISISVEDLSLILNTLIVINKRGGFVLEEYKSIGELYDKLYTLLKANVKQN